MLNGPPTAKDLIRYAELQQLGGSPDVRVGQVKALAYIHTSNPEEPAFIATDDKTVVTRENHNGSYQVDCCVSSQHRGRQAEAEITKEPLQLWLSGFNTSIIALSGPSDTGKTALLLGTGSNSSNSNSWGSNSSSWPGCSEPSVLEDLLRKAFQQLRDAAPGGGAHDGSSSGSSSFQVGLSCWQLLGKEEVDLLEMALTGDVATASAQTRGASQQAPPAEWRNHSEAGVPAGKDAPPWTEPCASENGFQPCVVEVRTWDEAQRVLTAATECREALSAAGSTRVGSTSGSPSASPLHAPAQQSLPHVGHLVVQLVLVQQLPGRCLSRLTLVNLAAPAAAPLQQVPGSCSAHSDGLARRAACLAPEQQQRQQREHAQLQQATQQQLERLYSLMADLAVMHAGSTSKDMPSRDHVQAQLAACRLCRLVAPLLSANGQPHLLVWLQGSSAASVREGCKALRLVSNARSIKTCMSRTSGAGAPAVAFIPASQLVSRLAARRMVEPGARAQRQAEASPRTGNPGRAPALEKERPEGLSAGAKSRDEGLPSSTGAQHQEPSVQEHGTVTEGHRTHLSSRTKPTAAAAAVAAAAVAAAAAVVVPGGWVPDASVGVCAQNGAATRTATMATRSAPALLPAALAHGVASSRDDLAASMAAARVVEQEARIMRGGNQTMQAELSFTAKSATHSPSSGGHGASSKRTLAAKQELLRNSAHHSSYSDRRRYASPPSALFSEHRSAAAVKPQPQEQWQMLNDEHKHHGTRAAAETSPPQRHLLHGKPKLDSSGPGPAVSPLSPRTSQQGFHKQERPKSSGGALAKLENRLQALKAKRRATEAASGAIPAAAGVAGAAVAASPSHSFNFVAVSPRPLGTAAASAPNLPSSPPMQRGRTTGGIRDSGVMLTPRQLAARPESSPKAGSSGSSHSSPSLCGMLLQRREHRDDSPLRPREHRDAPPLRPREHRDASPLRPGREEADMRRHAAEHQHQQRHRTHSPALSPASKSSRSSGLLKASGGTSRQPHFGFQGLATSSPASASPRVLSSHTTSVPTSPINLSPASTRSKGTNAAAAAAAAAFPISLSPGFRSMGMHRGSLPASPRSASGGAFAAEATSPGMVLLSPRVGLSATAKAIASHDTWSPHHWKEGPSPMSRAGLPCSSSDGGSDGGSRSSSRSSSSDGGRHVSAQSHGYARYVRRLPRALRGGPVAASGGTDYGHRQQASGSECTTSGPHSPACSDPGLQQRGQSMAGGNSDCLPERQLGRRRRRHAMSATPPDPVSGLVIGPRARQANALHAANGALLGVVGRERAAVRELQQRVLELELLLREAVADGEVRAAGLEREAARQKRVAEQLVAGGPLAEIFQVYEAEIAQLHKEVESMRSGEAEVAGRLAATELELAAALRGAACARALAGNPGATEAQMALLEAGAEAQARQAQALAGLKQQLQAAVKRASGSEQQLQEERRRGRALLLQCRQAAAHMARLRVLEREATEREERSLAAGLAAAEARGRADRLELEASRLRNDNEVLMQQNQNLLTWRDRQLHKHSQGTQQDAHTVTAPAAHCDVLPPRRMLQDTTNTLAHKGTNMGPAAWSPLRRVLGDATNTLAHEGSSMEPPALSLSPSTLNRGALTPNVKPLYSPQHGGDDSGSQHAWQGSHDMAGAKTHSPHHAADPAWQKVKQQGPAWPPMKEAMKENQEGKPAWVPQGKTTPHGMATKAARASAGFDAAPKPSTMHRRAVASSVDKALHVKGTLNGTHMMRSGRGDAAAGGASQRSSKVHAQLDRMIRELTGSTDG